MGVPATKRADDPGQLLEDLFTRSQSQLLGTLYYLLGNMDDARDALQETFLKCWRAGDELRSVDNPKAWVFRIALNTGRDMRKSAWHRRRQSLAKDESMLVSNQPSPEASVDRDDQLGRVRQALAALRPEEQEVFLLRQNGEMTYDQIAATVGVPTGTVKTRMRLALTKLRTALAT